ncbi:hypothetical protein [Clostridium manihotivorum]|nr:hypothetical protein [Clostridium manihotivorum]
MKKTIVTCVVSVLLLGAILIPSLPTNNSSFGHTVIAPMNDWPEPMQ